MPTTFILLKKQTPLTNQYDQINTINKNYTNVTCKDKEKSPTKDSKKIATKQNNKKPICYKCKRIGHYQNNCISDKNCRNQPFKSNSKLKTPKLHLEIKALKQEIKDIKTSDFQIREEQLAHEMIALKINNSYPQHPINKEEIKP